MTKRKSEVAAAKSADPAASLPDPVRHFDQLPDSAFVRVPTICALYGIGPATVWRWSESGRLPAPEKLGPRVSAWNVGLLRAARAKVPA